MQQKSSTYVRQALTQIAFEMGKPISLVEPYIEILEENWYETKEQIKMMKQENFDEFKIPKRIGQLLMEFVQRADDMKQNWQLELTKIISEISDQDQLFKTLEIIFKIISNVIMSPLSQDKQKINICSKTLQNNILKYPSALNYLSKLGWKIEAEFLLVEYKMDNQNDWKEAVEELVNYTQKKSGFNPQKPSVHTSSQNVSITSELAKSEGYDVYSFSQKLEQLHQRRFEIMNQPITNREIKVFIGRKQQSPVQLQQQIQGQEDYEEVQPQKDQQLLKFLQQVAQSLEEQQFASKRKKEYEELLNKPIFCKTDIRVQFPNSMIVQAIFGPLETLQALYDLIKDMLVNSNLEFYLYTSPPPLRMTQKYLKQTFDDLSSVPNGLFYFGVEKQTSEFYLKEEWMKQAKEL
ncbi:unnamed protein product (macronuclear) [Paramecium tetraurelia]|uniref:UBX domain-containing protein n=1 Tax=Paramecium tetraurelia TaxID=5888 RepID=A0C5Y6_PARTE|nr:uncharacterized protein GSPATT00035332001 [Paramecium tetraurelia]CAK66203.1 unnamed protein product [Paramecium tetraurelia]|eukprot:XP_001433600.1 hypothetical protein (macronuclear) [Paramecium tetraurelia strain d4-2]